eukprot:CAMPEP_0119081936 /NCGR_PEP_ID=MMETSP1178-20130426/119042_1 /TAXON_ID=33656 /ORGANISM="unid sp, Strain CCMP2000" /LENGTH=144 /DNA_ID=CAMNT_0007064675 /DNA_START=116 /DNA_END=550 /DNA_ORIENTATION=+
MLDEAASLLYVGLGCARMPKKLLLTGTTIIPQCTPEKVPTSHLHGACEYNLPHEEATLSAAPSRRGSFDECHYAGSSYSPADSWVSAKTKAVPRQAPVCHECHATITGTVFMAFDRAFCGEMHRMQAMDVMFADESKRALATQA